MCICVCIHFHRALAEGPMRHSHSSSWTGERVPCACTRGHLRPLHRGLRAVSITGMNSNVCFHFSLSTVTENVQTISRIDFLKSCYCCFAFSPTVTFHHFRYPHPVLNYHFFICICISQNDVPSTVRFLSFYLD